MEKLLKWRNSVRVWMCCRWHHLLKATSWEPQTLSRPSGTKHGGNVSRSVKDTLVQSTPIWMTLLSLHSACYKLGKKQKQCSECIDVLIAVWCHLATAYDFSERPIATFKQKSEPHVPGEGSSTWSWLRSGHFMMINNINNNKKKSLNTEGNTGLSPMD